MTVKLIIFSLLFATYTHASTNGINSAWKGFSAPEIMASGFTHKLRELPLQGMVQVGPKNWSSSYWPSFQGGINVRWNLPKPVGFKYASPTKEEVSKMSLEALALLSPTEKYDLFVGNYAYPLKKTVAASVDPGADEWAGICHGWAPASLLHNEPAPKVMTNPDGIQIPFGTADIKGLLSYYYASIDDSSDQAHQVGLRCFFGGWLGGVRGCADDLNAGAFHIIITNMLGLRKEGFLADIDRLKEVWNQPVVGYKSTILKANLSPSPSAATETVREMLVETEFYYVDESEHLTWDLVHGTKEQIIGTKKYEYRLELNAAGQIIGGDWESKERPDFLWNKSRVTSFGGALSRLTELLND